MSMHVDVVAAPLRYRRTPLLLLLLIAVVPAVGLLAAHLWLGSEADLYESGRDTGAQPAGDIAPVSSDGVPTGAEADADARRALLTTSLFDYRRFPGPAADLANANRLSTEVRPLFGFLNETSCAAVSANGIDVAAVNADGVVIPASIQKLVIAAVALEILGADHTFSTTVRTPLPVDGVVDGDVYLVGGGDPLLTADDYPIADDRYPAFATTSLDDLADAFVANGITRIRGTVIGDGTRYDDEWVVEGWGPGVAFDSAGPYDALLVNDARVLGRGGVEDDPNRAAARELARLLGNRNVRVDDGWGSGRASTDTNVIGTVESAPLSEIVREMLTNSDNNTAELLVKEIGLADVAGQGAGTGAGDGEVDDGPPVGTRAAGLTAIDRTLRSWGVSMSGVRILDGSGLHLDNRMTCAAMLDVLQRSRPTAIPGGLAVAGRTGTLRDEFVGTEMAGSMFAKTGTLGNPPVDEPPSASKALAGYVNAGDGGTIEFVVVINAPEITEADYRELWDSFGERFATFPAVTDDALLGPKS